MENETQKQLEILVIEDNPLHQEGARILLARHNVEIVGTFDEAADRICGPSRIARNPSSEKRKYDVVLTDMFLPQGRGDCLADKSQGSIEMPFGYSIALMACKEDTPHVAILTDGNHHANGIIYSLDFLNGTLKEVGNSKLAILTTENRDIKGYVYKTPDGRIGNKEEVGIKETLDSGKERFNLPEDSKSVKNWKAALDYVMSIEKD